MKQNWDLQGHFLGLCVLLGVSAEGYEFGYFDSCTDLEPICFCNLPSLRHQKLRIANPFPSVI